MTQTLAILNQKGGVGKTTTAINLAAYLSKSGKSVLLVDLDPQGNATSGLGLNKQNIEHTTYEVLLGRSTLKDAILSARDAAIDLLPTNANLAGAEVELVSQEHRELKLKQALTGVKYDIVLIDCPPALGLLTLNALAAASGVLIPVQTEYYAMEGLSQLISVIQRVQAGLNPTLKVTGVVLTMYDKRTSLSDQVAVELRRFFGDKVLDTVIPRNVRLAEAPSYGKTIADHDKWSKGARAYKQLAKELLKKL